MVKGILDSAIATWESIKERYSKLSYNKEGLTEIINNAKSSVKIVGGDVELDLCQTLYNTLYNNINKGVETKVIFSNNVNLSKVSELEKKNSKLQVYIALKHLKQSYIIIDNKHVIFPDSTIFDILKKKSKATMVKNDEEYAQRLSNCFDKYIKIKTENIIQN